MSTQNRYGIVRPEYQGVTDAYGNLKSQYEYTPGTASLDFNSAALDRINQEAARGPGEASQWRNLQQENINAQAAGVNANMARQQEAALDQAAMRGGVSGGAAERMAANSVGQSLKAQQNVYGMGLQADMTDEQNRLNAINAANQANMNFSQMQLGADQFNTQAQNQGQQYNINMLSNNLQNQNKFDMQKYGEDMGTEATMRTAASAPKSEKKGCVIATHGVMTGGFSKMEKAKAEVWCKKTYHDKWYGEAFRRGYRAAGQRYIDNGTAEKHYQEFKDFVSYGRGVKKGFKLAVNYYLRTVQFFVTGLFIKED